MRANWKSEQFLNVSRWYVRQVSEVRRSYVQPFRRHCGTFWFLASSQQLCMVIICYCYLEWRSKVLEEVNWAVFLEFVWCLPLGRLWKQRDCPYTRVLQNWIEVRYIAFKCEPGCFWIHIWTEKFVSITWQLGKEKLELPKSGLCRPYIGENWCMCSCKI